MKNGEKKYTTLTAKLQRVLARLEEVEREIQGMESMWGGPLQKINLVQYEHDPVMWNTVVAARNRYGYLQQEREVLREMIHAIRRKLAEVRP